MRYICYREEGAFDRNSTFSVAPEDTRQTLKQMEEILRKHFNCTLRVAERKKYYRKDFPVIGENKNSCKYVGCYGFTNLFVG